MEGEGEPAEISRIKAELRTAAEDNEQAEEWLGSAMETSWGVAEALLRFPELADLVSERHRIISNDWQAASLMGILARNLERALAILEVLDFSPAAIRADLDGTRAFPAFLHSACDLIDYASDLAAQSGAGESLGNGSRSSSRATSSKLLDALEHLLAHHEADRVHQVRAEPQLLGQTLPGDIAAPLEQSRGPLLAVEQVEAPGRLRSPLVRRSAEHEGVLGIQTHDLEAEARATMEDDRVSDAEALPRPRGHTSIGAGRPARLRAAAWLSPARSRPSPAATRAEVDRGGR